MVNHRITAWVTKFMDGGPGWDGWSERERWQARFVRWLSLTLGTVSLLRTAICMVGVYGPFLPWSLLILITIFAGTFLVNRQGYLRTSSWILIIGLGASLSVIGVTHSTVALRYLGFVVIMAGVLLRPADALILGGLLFALALGVLPTVLDQPFLPRVDAQGWESSDFLLYYPISLLVSVPIATFISAMTHLLISEKELAHRQSRAMSAFLAQVSHDVRTPLNGMLGMAQLLDASPLEAAQRRHLDTLMRSGDQLGRLVNDILDLAQIEAGRLVLHTETFNLRDVVLDVVAPFAETCRERGLSLDCELDARLPEWVQGDPVRLQQVLANLVANAVKFTDTGRLTVTALPLGDPGAGIRLQVSDTGIGIPPAYLDGIFDPYAQIPTSPARRRQGVGLGLAICRQLVTRMGGTIRVTSTVGSGSTFTVDLPLTAAPAAPPATGLAPALRILVADDDAASRQFLRDYLEMSGHEVVTVSNGREALAIATDDGFDLAIIDVQMPEMDGLTASRAIRMEEAAGGGRRLPIVALTADTLAVSSTDGILAGVDLVLAKPLTIEQLRKTFTQLGITQPPAGLADPEAPGGADFVMAALPEALRRDPQRLTHLLGIFLDDLPATMIRLQGAIVQAQTADVRRQAHKLAGILAQLQVPMLEHQARHLGSATDVDGMAAVAAELGTAVERLCQQLRAARQQLALPPAHPSSGEPS